jgi:RND family efflux transporter MFP subunit
MKRKYIIAAVIIAVALIGWQIYQKSLGSTNQSTQRKNLSVAVEIMPVKKATILEVGVYTGTLLPESQFIVAPKIAGKLKKIFVNIGDEIKQGQVIALLDDDEFVQQVDQARAELDVARANIEEYRSALSLKQREFERAKTLREKKIVSESELDAAEAQYKAALAKQKVSLAQASQKEAELKTSQVRLGYTRISAFWEDGSQSRFVGERYVDEGTMLSANAAIASVIDINTLEAVIHVIERDYPRVRTGQDAVITTDAYPDRVFNGTIARVAPILKEAARQARVEIAIPNPDKVLKPGMFVRVRIEFDRHDNATIVPLNALMKSNGQKSVFLADRETMRVKRIPVEVGIIEGDMAEVLEPAIAGYVVTVGQHLLEDGAEITLPEYKNETSHPGADDEDSKKEISPDQG